MTGRSAVDDHRPFAGREMLRACLRSFYFRQLRGGGEYGFVPTAAVRRLGAEISVSLDTIDSLLMAARTQPDTQPILGLAP